MNLHQLAAAIQTRELSAEEVVRRSLERIERDNPTLNAVVSLRADEALAEAHEVDDRIGRGGDPRPLAGIPALVKDMEDVDGMRTTFGSLAFATAPLASSDGLIPRRLRKAGAIIVGKTNLPEFAWQGYTDNRLFGATRNPWNPKWSPGGSSGGSGAALAAGLAPIATATDGGGSARIPAAFCGLVGLKPSHGIIGREPIPDWIDLSEFSPMATSIDDLRLLLGLEQGPVPGDPTALPYPLERRLTMPRRVLALERFTDEGPLPDSLRTRFAAALAAIDRDLKLPIERLDPGDVFRTGSLPQDWYTLCSVEQLHHYGRDWVRAHWDEFDPGFQRGMEGALQLSLDQYLDARRRRFAYVKDLDVLLGKDSVLATPTLGWAGWAPDGTVPETGDPPDDRAYNTFPPNVCGHPALSVPAGLSENGLPFGIMFTAPRFQDQMLLGIGQAWQDARPWPSVAPGSEPFPE